MVADSDQKSVFHVVQNKCFSPYVRSQRDTAAPECPSSKEGHVLVAGPAPARASHVAGLKLLDLRESHELLLAPAV